MNPVISVFAFSCVMMIMNVAANSNVQVSLSSYQVSVEQQSTEFCYQVQLQDSPVIEQFAIRLYKNWNNDNNKLMGLSAPEDCEIRVSFVGNALLEFSLSAIAESSEWTGEFCVDIMGLVPLDQEGFAQVKLAQEEEHIIRVVVPGPAGNGADFVDICNDMNECTADSFELNSEGEAVCVHSHICEQQPEEEDQVQNGESNDDNVVVVSASFSKKAVESVQMEEGMELLARATEQAMYELEVQQAFSQLLNGVGQVYVVELKQHLNGLYSAVLGFVGDKTSLQSVHVSEFEQVGLEKVEVSYLKGEVQARHARQILQMAEAEENFQVSSGASSLEVSFWVLAVLCLSYIFL